MSRRAEHWQLPRWELAVFNPADPAVDYGKWPSYALANDLIRAYFSHEGLYLPVLRKSDFERDYAMGRWRTDRAFARLSLLVFAVASRWVSSQEVYWAAQDDPLRPEDRAREIPTQSAGWRYLQEAIKLGNNLLALPNVSDLQAQVVSGIQAEDSSPFQLLAMFVSRSSVPTTVCLITSNGLKACVDLALHRPRASLVFKTPAEQEDYQRTFWCLIYLDRNITSWLGRTPALLTSEYVTSLNSS
jgi:hypothetical protein